MGIHLLMQGPRVWSLVRKNSTSYGATKPLSHKYWPRAPQHEKPLQRAGHALQRRAALPAATRAPVPSSKDPAQPRINKSKTQLSIFVPHLTYWNDLKLISVSLAGCWNTTPLHGPQTHGGRGACVTQRSDGLHCAGPLRTMGPGGGFWQNRLHWRREWQTTPVFVPQEPREQYEKAKTVTPEDEAPRSESIRMTLRKSREIAPERMKRLGHKWKWRSAVAVSGGVKVKSDAVNSIET